MKILMFTSPKHLFYFSSFILLLSINSACKSTYSGQIYKNHEVHFHLEEPTTSNWKRIKIDKSKLAWFNQKENSGILVNALCKGVDDVPLKALTRHLLIGLNAKKLIKKTSFLHDKRAALKSYYKVNIDGVSREIRTFVIKKNTCVFDILLEGPPNTSKASIQTFEKMIASFYTIDD